MQHPRSLRIGFALVAFAAGIAGPAGAQEFQPYPQPKVTPEQYAAYAEEVRLALGHTADVIREENIIVFSNPATRTFYVFTTKKHPAHPAWITRQMVEEDGQVNVHQIGFFAGSEKAFATLFAEYQGRNAQLMDDVARRNR
jgi:hypothetical protein